MDASKLKEMMEQMAQIQKEMEAKSKKEEEFIQNLQKQGSSTIDLNVGGQLFSTSLTTLRSEPDSMLAAMFSGRFEAPKDKNGRIFLDRDPTYFQSILNWLRNG
jgi:hypothetical protein